MAEILRMVAITPVPGAPPALAGVINLRGRAVPIADLRVRLGFPPAVPGLATPIIVARVEDRLVGLVADEMTGAVRVPDGVVGSPEGLTAHGRAVSGLARLGDRLVVVLDPARLVEGSERVVLPEHALDAG